jgi:DNA mismatch endonuclease (patch repair protein)
MSRIRGKDTTPEIIVRKLLYSLGYRYRIHRRDIPGTPDIAFIGRKKLIFVHGCFWHRHPGCKYAYIPKSNTDRWLTKFTNNVARDARIMDQLTHEGWQVLVVWECETKDLEKLTDKLLLFLD